MLRAMRTGSSTERPFRKKSACEAKKKTVRPFRSKSACEAKKTKVCCHVKSCKVMRSHVRSCEVMYVNPDLRTARSALGQVCFADHSAFSLQVSACIIILNAADGLSSQASQGPVSTRELSQNARLRASCESVRWETTQLATRAPSTRTSSAARAGHRSGRQSWSNIVST